MRTLPAADHFSDPVAPFDTPVCLSAPTHRIRSLAELTAVDAAAARTISSRLLAAADRIATCVPTPKDLHAVLDELSWHMSRAMATSPALAVTPAPSSPEQSRVTLDETVSRDVLQLNPTADLQVAVNGFARYDEYFGIRRSDSLTPESFLHQVLLTVGIVLADLPRCMLDSHEIVMILRATAAGISGAGNAADAGEGRADIARASADAVSGEELRGIAIWRWKIGHHLFNQYAVMSLHMIEDCMASEDPESQAGAIDRLCHTYRGATASMWYAQAFPSVLYKEFVRPSMEEASRNGSGFSGTDSLDCRLMRIRMREMLARLEADTGAVDTWPEVLWRAVWRLHEAKQLDLEHHVLIAHKLVGNAPSLKQARLMERLGGRSETAEISAIDTLRGMVQEQAEAKAKFLAV